MKLISKLNLIILLIITFEVFAHEKSELGKINFKSSSNREAQHFFERGVLLLHNFEYAPARLAFQAAERIDPQDAMAYWGEAMTYNHPIWNEQDFAAGKKVLNTLDTKNLTTHLTAKENSFIQAIHLLYGSGNKIERDRAYADAMGNIYQQYPQDDEAATFYALALLGTTEKSRDFAIYMQAAGILEVVFARNPLHPGAAHYLIHSYDDAVHAPLGLRPARVYAKIAPAASHALHMPSHIFLALGMWDDLIASNQAAWAFGENKWQLCKKEVCNTQTLLNDMSDSFHALQWLMYGYLQKQAYRKAYAATLIAKQFAETKISPQTKWYYALMRAAYMSETQDWQANLKAIDLSDMALSVRANDFYVNGMIALAKGENTATVNAMINHFANSIPKSASLTKPQESYYTAITPSGITIAKIAISELKAQVKLKEGKVQEAINLLHTATQLEDKMPLSYGPPFPVKPPHELLAEIYMHDKQYAEAYREYQNSLKRAPHRKISEDGLHLAAIARTI